LYKWTMFDARKKTHLETANVPSQDQLQTRLDVSVQYRIDGSMASKIQPVEACVVCSLKSIYRINSSSCQRPLIP
jgi:hypothetical protein